MFITASIGLAKSGFGGVDVPTELLQAADVAMYVAKARGKDRYEVFDPEMHAAVQRRHELGPLYAWPLAKESSSFSTSPR